MRFGLAFLVFVFFVGIVSLLELEMSNTGRRGITSFGLSSEVNEGDINGAASIANSRNFQPQRSNTFPPVGSAAASYGRVFLILDFALPVLLLRAQTF